MFADARAPVALPARSRLLHCRATRSTRRCRSPGQRRRRALSPCADSRCPCSSHQVSCRSESRRRRCAGECSRCSALSWMPLHWQTLRLGTVVQCPRATAARIGCPFAPLYCTGTAGPAGPPAPDTSRVASPATEPTPKAPKRSASAANLTPTGGDIRSFFPKK
jgi:hypothetical protein